MQNNKKNAKHRFSQKPGGKVNWEHKDRLFRLLFSSKKELLQLYNAVRGSDYTNPDDLEITTIDNTIYMSMKNDVSFLIDNVLNLYEHQASFNPNMGFRGFLYLADSYRKYVKTRQLDLYSSIPIKLPLPQYVIFYNGLQEQPDRTELHLTDLFEKSDGLTPCVEVTATMLNINRGHNRVLMEKCRTLWEYAEFIGRIRENINQGFMLEDAVDDAVESCIRDNILADYLKAHRAEVKEIMLTEYDEKFHIAHEKKISREEGIAEGLAQGIAESVLQLLNDLSDIPDDLRDKILQETNLEALRQWLKAAAKADSIQDFRQLSGL